MFRQPTVFILGAGASCHYGFPTGEQLIEQLIAVSNMYAGVCDTRLTSNGHVQIPEFVAAKVRGQGIRAMKAAWEETKEECVRLADRLTTVRPLLIDYFLEWNETLQDVGKLAVATAILLCQMGVNIKPKHMTAREVEAAAERRDDWHRFIVHKLVYGCTKSVDIMSNEVHFVTFNYDTSLENHLYESLTAIDLLKEGDVLLFLEKRIMHIYGSVSTSSPIGPFAPSLERDDYQAMRSSDHSALSRQKDFWDMCWQSAQGLRTINPHEKVINGNVFSEAKDIIGRSEVIYILGYGFDENNSKRIGLEEHCSQLKNIPSKKIMFTNFKNANSINKRASKLLFNSPSAFINEYLYTTHGGYAEKSTENVYNALSRDFDTLEE